MEEIITETTLTTTEELNTTTEVIETTLTAELSGLSEIDVALLDNSLFPACSGSYASIFINCFA